MIEATVKLDNMKQKDNFIIISALIINAPNQIKLNNGS